jgi:hypothetical protein
VHPKVAHIDCDDCKKHVYNLKSGKRLTYETDEGMLPILRVDDPPCHVCPKKSPENGKRLKLSDRNRRFVDFYYRVHASGMRHPLLDCPVTQRNMRIVDSAIELAKIAISKRAMRKLRRKKK